ncbi:LPXTG cell wall anchor domain-containing protein [Phaeacidiphilus oryzae]|uniref:LPXTG cell wall anchor domain-containing protein n=1 Tax=Phaeacidiphilus oryzae TaxID=348818 RepID=UPI00055BA712|nr:LPXTG cell wall anchor domain-containing protein [Phaeacidiphilus oryzae]
MAARTRLAAVLAATAAALVGVPMASAHAASTVPVNYQCKTPIGNKSAVSDISITDTKSGSSYKLTMSFAKGVSSSPIELGPGAMHPSAVIEVGGADSGTVKVSGPPNSAAIPANTPIKINDLSGTYAPHHNGQVTFTPGVLTISALGTTTTCTPATKPQPALTLDVTGATAGGGGGGSTGGSGGGTGGAGSGGGSGSGAGAGSGTSTGSGGTASGTLPQTGPSDNAVAFGLLGGTVLLVGVGGGLVLNRRRSTRS